MENSLRSPPPSYNALHSLTNPVYQCCLNHSTDINIDHRLNGKANRSNPSMLPSAGTSDSLESSPDGNSFHTFNPSDSRSHVQRGSHVQKLDLFPKSRSQCHHPICSWWRWRGKEEEVCWLSLQVPLEHQYGQIFGTILISKIWNFSSSFISPDRSSFSFDTL